MATVAAVQAQLGTTGRDAAIINTRDISSALVEYFVEGDADAAGAARWVAIDASKTAANQAADILTALDNG